MRGKGPMTVAADSTAAPSHHYWLRIGLMVVAALELMDALASLTTISLDSHAATALLRLVQTLLNVKLALAPLAAAAALVFAVLGWLRPAVLALAAFAFMGWALDDVWSIVIHGFGFRPDQYYGSVDAFAHEVLFPLGALLGAGLALHGRHLAWAGFFASLPPLFNWTGVLLFAASVMMHGF
jgi:hypothetical protein